MPLLSDTYTDPYGNTTLEEYLALMRAIINGLDNDNVRVSAGIESAKIQNGAMFTAHATRHSAGGADSLGKSAISGYMIQPRSIASHHLGVEAVLGEHLSPGAITSGSYRDTAPVTYANGDVINAPTGYENSKMDLMLVGFEMNPLAARNCPQMPIKIYIAPGEAVVCTLGCYDDQPNDAFTPHTGNVFVIRRCWP